MCTVSLFGLVQCVSDKVICICNLLKSSVCAVIQKGTRLIYNSEHLTGLQREVTHQ